MRADSGADVCGSPGARFAARFPQRAGQARLRSVRRRRSRMSAVGRSAQPDRLSRSAASKASSTPPPHLAAHRSGVFQDPARRHTIRLSGRSSACAAPVPRRSEWSCRPRSTPAGMTTVLTRQRRARLEQRGGRPHPSGDVPATALPPAFCLTPQDPADRATRCPPGGSAAVASLISEQQAETDMDREAYPIEPSRLGQSIRGSARRVQPAEPPPHSRDDAACRSAFAARTIQRCESADSGSAVAARRSQNLERSTENARIVCCVIVATASPETTGDAAGCRSVGPTHCRQGSVPVDRPVSAAWPVTSAARQDRLARRIRQTRSPAEAHLRPGR